LRLEFSTDPGPVALSRARLVEDAGVYKHYLIESDETSLIEVIADVPQGFGLKDVTVEEPMIEEVIRSFYQNKPSAMPMRTA
jgi:ABC-2 type transport system ATP-binding protein